MKLASRGRSKKERAIDATSDLAKLWVAAKLTKATAPGRKAGGLKAVGAKKTGRRAVAGKALAGSKTGRRAAIGKPVASSKTGRGAGRKLLGAALAGKAAKGAGKRRSGKGRGRKLLVLGGTAGAVAIALKGRKGKSDDQDPTWTPPDVPVGGATLAGDTTVTGGAVVAGDTTVTGETTVPPVPPGPTSLAPSGGAPTDAVEPATLREENEPNVGATGYAPEAADEQADRS